MNHLLRGKRIWCLDLQVTLLVINDEKTEFYDKLTRGDIMKFIIGEMKTKGIVNRILLLD